MKPLCILGGSNLAVVRCIGWIESLSLWHGALLETEMSFRSLDYKCLIEVLFRSVKVLFRNIGRKYRIEILIRNMD